MVSPSKWCYENRVVRGLVCSSTPSWCENSKTRRTGHRGITQFHDDLHIRPPNVAVNTKLWARFSCKTTPGYFLIRVFIFIFNETIFKIGPRANATARWRFEKGAVLQLCGRRWKYKQLGGLVRIQLTMPHFEGMVRIQQLEKKSNATTEKWKSH